MTSNVMGEAVVELSDGRKLRLAYDFDGLIALEEAAGMKITAVYAELKRLERMKEEPSLRFMRAIFFGGLQQHHPEITLKEVGGIITNDMEALTKAFSAFQGSHGPADEGGQAGDAEAGPIRKAAGTGARSSKAGAAPGSVPKASGGKRSGRTRRR